MADGLKSWNGVVELLIRKSQGMDSGKANPDWLNEGQRASLRGIAERLPSNGVIVADEVGMGKTRIAVALAECVVRQGGRVAILIPPGLGYQWLDELRAGGIIDVPPILRSLWSYLEAWKGEPAEHRPWFNQNVLLVSHVFANWRLEKSAAAWRWSLLPALYGSWRQKRQGRFPREFHGSTVLNDDWVCNAADSIARSIFDKEGHPAGEELDRLLESIHWPGPLNGDYSIKSDLRRWLERVVGIGLGSFDLVIIDEAHKNRGHESGLSRLLERIVLPARHARRLGMTATPFEMHMDQWKQILPRIGISKQRLGKIPETISRYSESVRKLRLGWRSNPGLRSEYAVAARDFQSALGPFLLRRDKREDPWVGRFRQYSGLPFNSYRQENEIPVDVLGLSESWKQAVFAAEALSFVAHGSEHPFSKRIRLSIGNGHGISFILSELQSNEVGEKQEMFDAANCRTSEVDTVESEQSREAALKRNARVRWWQNALASAFRDSENSIYYHPAIAAATRSIEETTARGEKVLVFGRFTLPMRELVNLLNAREMVRRLAREGYWPQAKVHGDRAGRAETSEWPAVRAAFKQLHGEGYPNLPDESRMDELLAAQYNRFDSRRQQFRDGLISGLKQGFEARENHGRYRYFRIFDSFSKSVDQDPKKEDLLILSRALFDIVLPPDGIESPHVDPAKLVKAFEELVASATDRDDPDADLIASDMKDDSADLQWKSISCRLQEEYNRTQGGFARLMHGDTTQHSRRMIQLAFNRPFSFPKVLVAQSLVGREGLNLHTACRTVILLHPEWNPGVVEQQIGRIDRISSYWCNLLDQAIKEGKTGEDLPRIEVRPVVFKGTYDEYNWKVLRERWDDLRAQLHGIVIPERYAQDCAEFREIRREISESAPVFSPLKNWT